MEQELRQMKISELQKVIHQNAKDKGFYDNPNQNFGEKCMLIVSEVSEALEAHRKNEFANLNAFDLPKSSSSELSDKGWFNVSFVSNVKDTVEDELADALIRILDLAGWLNIDLERHVALKIEYNAGRERLHGKSY